VSVGVSRPPGLPRGLLFEGMNAEPSPDHVSTAEAAAILGVTPHTVRKAVRSGDLPAVAVHGNIRIPRSALSGAPAAAPDPNSATIAEMLFGQPLDQLPLLVDASWLAPRLGMCVRTCQRAINDGDIPSVLVGRRRRVPTIALLHWLYGKNVAA